MIYRLYFMVDPATFSQLRKKKLCCVSVGTCITEKNAICKLKNDNEFEMIYFLSFDGDNLETVAASKCYHDWTFGLANYRGSPMTTGSYFNSNCGKKTEIYNFESNQWNDAPDYPFNSLVSINDFSIFNIFSDF